MILAIPYNRRLTDYQKLETTLRKIGTNPSHAIAVVSTREDENEAFEFMSGLSDGYLRNFSIVIPDAMEHPVRLSNRMFLASMKALRDYKPKQEENKRVSMLYFDPRWVPTKHRWLDELQASYFIAGAPTTFGAFDLQDGKPIARGPMIFGQKYPAQSRLLDFVLESGRHWRDYLAWEIHTLATETDLIGGDPKTACLRPQTTKRNV